MPHLSVQVACLVIPVLRNTLDMLERFPWQDLELLY